MPQEMDAFRGRLSQSARAAGDRPLARQSLGRPITAAEAALAAALGAIYAAGTHDFAAVAAALARDAVVAPLSGRTDWTEALLGEELAAINADLDAAYAEHGYGA